jgi:hypothetical protein
MKNTLNLILVFISLAVNAQQHRIGVKGGAAFSNITTDIDFGNKTMRTGLIAGLTYEYAFLNKLYVGADVLYMQRGFVNKFQYIDQNAISISEYKSKYNFDYLSIPIKIGYSTGERYFMFAQLGVVTSYLVSAKYVAPPQFSIEGVTGFVNDMTNDFERFDLGGVFEIGGGYKFMERYMLYFSVAYQQRFTNLIKAPYNQDFRMSHYGVMANMGIKIAF